MLPDGTFRSPSIRAGDTCIIVASQEEIVFPTRTAPLGLASGIPPFETIPPKRCAARPSILETCAAAGGRAVPVAGAPLPVLSGGSRRRARLFT